MNSESAISNDDGPFTVYVAIPVFNRIEDTIKCLECLNAQTFKDLKVIVADGGSTDNTPAILREQYPDVVVLDTEEPLWWAGSTRMAIDWALDHSTNGHDFVLMLNNDTLFEPDYIQSLIKHSRAHNTAVCGMVVDLDDQSHIIDAGVSFHWETYAFVGRYERPQDEIISLDRSVLPGRGTLIPIGAVRKAGNVDDKHFPHYLADYEFTYRLKRDGDIGMAVAYDIAVRTKVDAPSAPPEQLPTFKEVKKRFKTRFLGRSKQNSIDHFWFIYLHSPKEYKIGLLYRIFKQNVKYIIKPIVDRLLMNPVLRFVARAIRFAFRVVRKIWRILFGPYLINTADVRLLDLDFYQLRQHKILEPSRFKGYFYPARGRRYLRKNYPEALPLYRRAAMPWRKFYRALDSRDFIPTRADLRAMVPESVWKVGRRVRTLLGPYLINTSDIQVLDLDFLALRQHKIIEPSRYEGYYFPARRRSYVRENYPEALALYNRASWPTRKIFRYLDSRGKLPAKAKMLFRPYLVNAADCSKCGLDASELLKSETLIQSQYDGYYVFSEEGISDSHTDKKLAALLKIANKISLKLYRFSQVRKQLKANNNG